MTTSGTASFNLDLNDIIEEAYERCGVEVRTGYEHRTARRSLNLLFADWANRGINLWTIEQGSFNLTQGVATYSLPVDTVDLLEHVIRTGAGNSATQADLTITRISVSTYATIPNKLTQGRPIQVWVNRQSGATTPTGVNSPEINVWAYPRRFTGISVRLLAYAPYSRLWWRSEHSRYSVSISYLPCIRASVLLSLKDS
jgi:hypothetical protein